MKGENGNGGEDEEGAEGDLVGFGFFKLDGGEHDDAAEKVGEEESDEGELPGSE